MNSINIRDVSSQQITDFFLKDPNICYLGLPDEDLVDLYENKEYIPKENSIYKGVYDVDDTLLCIVKYELFTLVSISLHFYISSTIHRTQQSIRIRDLLYKHFCEETTMDKVILMVPHTCVHVQKAATAFGMTLEGRLTNSVKWRNEMADILLYGLELKRNK